MPLYVVEKEMGHWIDDNYPLSKFIEVCKAIKKDYDNQEREMKKYRR